ncbi:hypothetical protein [Papillibacter cinnamivorans]|uniref:hypothetical protein n=1 Tax=Papillibacter cinnamivorans TaxID=100176 RepID=UPI0009FE674B|nr:hypothetical protein [Papillibacter cinnamivorans]
MGGVEGFVGVPGGGLEDAAGVFRFPDGGDKKAPFGRVVRVLRGAVQQIGHRVAVLGDSFHQPFGNLRCQNSRFPVFKGATAYPPTDFTLQAGFFDV